MRKQLMVKTDHGVFRVTGEALEFSEYDDGNFKFLVGFFDLPEFAEWLKEEYEKLKGV